MAEDADLILFPFASWKGDMRVCIKEAVKTEFERKRADAEKARADAIEKELQELKRQISFQNQGICI